MSNLKVESSLSEPLLQSDGGSQSDVTQSAVKRILKVSPRKNQGSERKRSPFWYQVGMFLMCYIAWVGVHMQREFWAMSKDVILEENPNLGTTYFGCLNTSLFMSYAMFQFGTGALGDTVPKKYVLGVSFTVQACIFIIIGILGMKYSETMASHLGIFCFLFALVGSIQSVDFPCLVGTIGAWTKRSTRGTITGIWATCGNVGNILGL